MLSPKTWQLMSMKQREVKGNPPHGFDVFTASHLKKTITIWVGSFYGLFALEEKCNHCILEVLYSYIEKSWQITTTSGANSGTGRHPCKTELVKKDKSYITPNSDVQQGTHRLEEEFVMKKHCKIATKRKRKKRPSSQQSNCVQQFCKQHRQSFAFHYDAKKTAPSKNFLQI